MTGLTPHKKLTAWKSCEAWERVHECRQMLTIHGFLTDVESNRVHQRIVKWCEKHRKADA